VGGIEADGVDASDMAAMGWGEMSLAKNDACAVATCRAAGTALAAAKAKGCGVESAAAAVAAATIWGARRRRKTVIWNACSIAHSPLKAAAIRSCPRYRKVRLLRFLRSPLPLYSTLRPRIPSLGAFPLLQVSSALPALR